MTVQVKVPTVLRKHTEGEASIDASGSTVRELIDDIVKKYPDFKDRVLTGDGQLHRFINVYANDEDVRYLDGLDTKLGDGDVLSILPAVAGGSG